MAFLKVCYIFDMSRFSHELTDSDSLDVVMGMIGTEIAKMHKADIIHGDLTTSNMMLRHPSSPKGLQLVRYKPIPFASCG